MAPFVPTLHDIHKARAILASLRLPNELAFCILDQAHYWMELEIESREHIVLMDGAWSVDYSAAYPYLYVPAYQWPHVPHLKIREITFTVVSHDQRLKIRKERIAHRPGSRSLSSDQKRFRRHGAIVCSQGYVDCER